jgi:hypothetical protein
LGEGEAGDAACEELFERRRCSLDEERALELSDGRAGETRWVRPPRVAQDAAHDPVGARDDSVDGGEIRVDEQVGHPGVTAAERQPIPIEEDDTGDPAWLGKPGRCSHTGSERVTHEYGALEMEVVFEASEEVEPAGHRVRAAAFAVAEGW